MNNFDYYAPTSIDEAVKLLLETEAARPFAGGTDLIPRMRNGLQVQTIIDIKKIPELNEIKTGDGTCIGAAVQLYKIYSDQYILDHYPALIDAVKNIGATAIQGRATLGGNICNASPSGDSLGPLIIYEAQCRITGPKGERTVKIEDFCKAPSVTALEQGELLKAVEIQEPLKGTGAAYKRFIPRGEMDISVVGVEAKIRLEKDIIKDARIALGAVAATPLLVKTAADVLNGAEPSEETWNKAAKAAREAAKPITDVRGGAEQRLHLVEVYTKRALREAYARAQGE